MSAPYPIDDLLAMHRSVPLCEWGGHNGMADGALLCTERPVYRCVVTGPDDVGDLCREHTVRMAEAINRMAEDTPWLGTVIAVPLEERA